ncbi:MAG: class I SAM-dependent methyltransferase [Flavisolibacter sp.]
MKRTSIKDYYEQEIESNRLQLEPFKLEGIRTKQIIERYLGKKCLEILDVGGGAGFYSFWLQEKGHRVTMVDLSPKNVELAKKYSEKTGIVLEKIETADALHLPFSGKQFDIVLLLGPLYHLTERSERIHALSEARKVLKPHGVLICAIISRYASLIDGFRRDLVRDDRFFSALKNDLQTGVHYNNTDNPEYFTTAYFHTPKEIREEIAESRLVLEKIIPVESFGWMIPDFLEKEKDPDYMKKMFEMIEMVEMNEDLLPMSPHIIAVATKS